MMSDYLEQLIGIERLRERDRCEALIRQYIRFDSDQQHLHSWHSLQDLLEDIRSGKDVEKPANPKRIGKRKGGA